MLLLMGRFSSQNLRYSLCHLKIGGSLRINKNGVPDVQRCRLAGCVVASVTP
jgi:hypothetical protein